MEKTLLTDLKKKMFIRSSLIAINSLDELLGLNDYLSPDEILLEIIKKALREFELTLPLILEMRMNRNQMGTCYGMPGFYEIKSNFTCWLNCILPDESYIILVPQSTPMWRIGSQNSFPVAGAYNYVSEYRKPYVFLGDIPDMSEIFIKGICARPIVPDWLPSKEFNPKSEKAAIYWMNVEEGADGTYFMDLCMVHLLDYLRQLKASISLPGLPVDFMSNLDSAYMELRARCDNYALQSGWKAQLVL